LLVLKKEDRIFIAHCCATPFLARCSSVSLLENRVSLREEEAFLSSRSTNKKRCFV
jgi:hypothetical protein